MTHEVEAFLNELSGQQAATERRVRLLLGAGASRSAGVPDLKALTAAVKTAVVADRKDSAELFDRGNVERVLTILRKMEGVLGPGETICGLGADAAREIEPLVTGAIVDEISKTTTTSQGYRNVVRWLADRQSAVAPEVFTLNYDWLLEMALDDEAMPYFDGFVGTMRARLRPDIVESVDSRRQLPMFVLRIWKLHGSIYWRTELRPGGGHEIIRSVASRPGTGAAIYPSEDKYVESRRAPFLVLHDRFRRSLHEPESLLLVSGYSFGDQHVSEVVFDAARDNPRLSVLVFLHRSIPPSVAEQAGRLRNISVTCESEAILGGTRAPWAGTDVAGVFEGGRFLLSEFENLAAFLAKGVPRTASAVTTPVVGP